MLLLLLLFLIILIDSEGANWPLFGREKEKRWPVLEYVPILFVIGLNST